MWGLGKATTYPLKGDIILKWICRTRKLMLTINSSSYICPFYPILLKSNPFPDVCKLSVLSFHTAWQIHIWYFWQYQVGFWYIFHETFTVSPSLSYLNWTKSILPCAYLFRFIQILIKGQSQRLGSRFSSLPLTYSMTVVSSLNCLVAQFAHFWMGIITPS